VRRTTFLGSLIGALVVPTIAPRCTLAPNLQGSASAQIGAPCPVHGYRSATIELTQHPWRWKYADGVG
jgi:hypothetical protein